MSSRRRNRAVQSLFYRASTLPQRALKALITNLLRVLLQWGRYPATTRAGFILPTTVMLLLVTSLAVGSITLRTYTRTQQTIGDRQQQIIYNAATPAIDRAKAKLEFLFRNDARLPNGVPGEGFLYGMMVNDGVTRNGLTVPPNNGLTAQVNGSTVTVNDPYTFLIDNQSHTANQRSEERLDLDGDGQRDNAWKYAADTDGDGDVDSWVIYSIVFGTPTDGNGQSNLDALADTRVEALEGNNGRARLMQVRQAPLSINQSNAQCVNQSPPTVENGWFSPGTRTGRKVKNFQVDVMVVRAEPDAQGNLLEEPNPQAAVATLEFQQDRRIDLGNKWGAWFLNDLEIFPGDGFRWNGAMHTEGSLLVAEGGEGESPQPKFTAYLVSADASCLNTSAEDSEVTVGVHKQQDSKPDFFGQIISGRVTAATNDKKKSTFHVFNAGGNPNTDERLLVENDSLINNLGNFEEIDFTVDPAVLLTTGEYTARGVEDGNGLDGTYREADWKELDTDPVAPPTIQGRIYNKRQETPRVGDSYRADNRYGPQANYGTEDPQTLNVGDPIPDTAQFAFLRDAGSPNEDEAGLDGLWERRARNDGMRVIVGQRLELGNAFGWSSPDDPLAPWNGDSCTTNPTNTGARGGCYVARQRRTLRDNLAAIQATTIYHADPYAATPTNDGDFPQACLITTVHPGTAATLERAATFRDLTAGLEELWDNAPFFDTAPGVGAFDLKPFYSNVFLGEGTNGWEYNVPAVTNFQAETPMMVAMRNLATYAGDPQGGAPSFEPVQDVSGATNASVHPNPNMAMWGDFSMLRRILDGPMSLPTQLAYDALSPADKTTLHTAGCLIGMLAYNVAYLEAAEVVDPATNALLPLMSELNTVLDELANSDVGDNGVNLGVFDAGGDPVTVNLPANVGDGPDTGTQIDASPEALIAVLDELDNGNADLEKYTNLAKIVMVREQVERDRKNGFGLGESENCIAWGGGLANLCSAQPKYPALHSIFPWPGTNPGDGDHGEVNDTTRDGTVPTYIATENAAPDIYKEVDLNNAPANLANLATLTLEPKTVENWALPKVVDATPAGSGESPNNNRDVLIACVDEVCGAGETGEKAIRVPFKDSAIFDGRQMMSVRVLDMELDLLRSNAFSNADTWLPRSGIVYAFREDTLREDSIVRPVRSGVPPICNTDNALQTITNCEMAAGGEGAVASDTFDPPLAARKYSVKPVDYTPDADRRVNAVRLRNGSNLTRPGYADNPWGITLVSDSPVYIQGNFNEHLVGNTKVEEFTQTLNVNYGNFYIRTNPNQDFANSSPGRDQWRPAEILADAVTILSDNFCDGSIEDGFLVAGDWPANTNPNPTTIPNDANNRYGCQGNGNQTSYLSQLSPAESVADTDWKRENQYDANSPILVSRHGNPVRNSTDADYTGAYYPLRRVRPLIIPPDVTTVNATIVSGIVPSRKDQSYGGLHNFPRFMEDWRDKELFMSGAFFQLNFSTSATAPYELDAWAPLETPVADDEAIGYYFPPERRWGYDVALQYAPPAPIARRFVIGSTFRSEFYDEPPVDDPYIAQLCQVGFPNSNFCNR